MLNGVEDYARIRVVGVGGGGSNTAVASGATIGGGTGNTASGVNSTVAGGGGGPHFAPLAPRGFYVPFGIPKNGAPPAPPGQSHKPGKRPAEPG